MAGNAYVERADVSVTVVERDVIINGTPYRRKSVSYPTMRGPITTGHTHYVRGHYMSPRYHKDACDLVDAAIKEEFGE